MSSEIVIDEHTLADVIAKAALSGVKRHFGDTTSGYDHSRRIADRVYKRYSDRQIENRQIGTIVALLHDVVEDSDITIDDLKPLFSDKVIEGVDLLTRYDGTTYFDYIRRIADSKNTVAIYVKLYDLQDNSQDGIPESLKKRTEKAKSILLNALDMSE